MNKATVQAVALVSGKAPLSTSLTAMVENLSEGQLLDAAIGAAQAVQGLATNIGSAMRIPLLNPMAIVNDLNNFRQSYAERGEIDTKDALSLASTLTAMAGTAALGAAVGAAAVVAAPAVTLGVLALTASAALTLASVKADGSIDVSSHVDAMKATARQLSDRFGDMYVAASSAIHLALERAGNTLSDITDSLVDGFMRAVPGFDIWGSEFDAVIDHIERQTQTASTVPSPIILDFDGDGIETVALASGAWFDHAADGFAERTGWVGRDDALLVQDLDGNGRIESGRELFGSETRLAHGTKAAHGFAALAELDANGDRRIDASDPAFARLRIWQDANGNGHSEADELRRLDLAGVHRQIYGRVRDLQQALAANEGRWSMAA